MYWEHKCDECYYCRRLMNSPFYYCTAQPVTYIDRTLTTAITHKREIERQEKHHIVTLNTTACSKFIKDTLS